MIMERQNFTLHKMLGTAMISGALSFTSVLLTAGEYELGLSAFNEGRYSEAFRLIKKSAEKGETKGQFVLSTMYQRGLGVEEDEFEGFYWCRKAAQEGLLEAQFQLGLMYLQGVGVTEDEAEAQNWLWSAADRGYPQATELLTYILSDEYSREHDIGC